MVLFMNNYKVNNLHINGKVASGIIKGLWYRVTFDFIPTKEEPGFWTCEEIAQANGCDFWTVCEL